MQPVEKCGAKNPATCRHHGIASMYAPVNDVKVAQDNLEKAGYEALSTVGKAEFNKAEKTRQEAHRQLLSVPSVLQLNKVTADRLWATSYLDTKESYRAYLRWNTGKIEREKREAIHRAATFSAKSLYGELTLKDLKSLAPSTSSVRVEDNKLFLDGSKEPFLGVENGKAFTYPDSSSEAKVTQSEESFNLGRLVAEKRVAQVEVYQEKLMLAHTKKLALHLGGRIERNVDSYSPKETIHTVYTGRGDAIAQYRTVKGIFARGTITIDGRQGTSRDAKLWDIEYRLIEASKGTNSDQYKLPPYMTEDESVYGRYDDFGRPLK